MTKETKASKILLRIMSKIEKINIKHNSVRKLVSIAQGNLLKAVVMLNTIEDGRK